MLGFYDVGALDKVISDHLIGISKDGLLGLILNYDIKRRVIFDYF